MTVYDMSGNPATWQPGVMTPTYFGCPWHGILKNGTLYENDAVTVKKTLPNWTQYASARVNSATQLIRVPGMPGISRTTEQQTWDAAQKFDWKNYALVGGYELYGKTLNNNWIIYIDGNNVPWSLDMNLSAGGAGFFATVYLRRIFGRISETSYSPINSTLTTYSDTSMATETGAVYKYSGPESIERNSTGSVVFVNVYAYKTRPSTAVTTLGYLDGGNDQFDSYKPKLGKLLAVYKIEITGNGSVSPSTLGDGISAAVTLYKDYSACYSTSSTIVNGVYVYYDPFDIDVDYSQDIDARHGPPCEAEYIDRYYVNPHVYAPTSNNTTVNYEDRLIRVLFDSSDNAIEYSIRREKSFGNKLVRSVVLAGSMTNEVTIPVTETVDSCVEGTQTQNKTGSITRTVTNVHESWEKITLKIDGSDIASADLTTASTDVIVDVRDWSGFSNQSSTSSTEYTCNGQALPSGKDVDDYYLIVHPYSPQIYGVQLRGLDVPPSYCRIESVIVPWGSDTTHQHTDLSHDGFNCVGTHEPIEQIAYWYEDGVSDVVGAKINFI